MRNCALKIGCVCVSVFQPKKRLHSLDFSLSFSCFVFLSSSFRFAFPVNYFLFRTFCLINFYLTFGSQSAAKNKSQIKKLNGIATKIYMSKWKKFVAHAKSEWRKTVELLFVFLFVTFHVNDSILRRKYFLWPALFWSLFFIIIQFWCLSVFFLSRHFVNLWTGILGCFCRQITFSTRYFCCCLSRIISQSKVKGFPLFSHAFVLARCVCLSLYYYYFLLCQRIYFIGIGIVFGFHHRFAS